jgi:ABC-type spermidine/putrescine transport system permease subunit I
MTRHAAPVAAPAPAPEPGAAARRRSLTMLRRVRDLAGVVPFTIYVVLGLVLPMGAILIGAFKTPLTGKLTLSNIHDATHGIYLHGFGVSMELSLIASIVPGVLGFLIAYAIYTAKCGAVLRRVAITASGVFANFGGVPLAFLFIATLGNTGLATRWLTDIGFNPYNNGFDLYGLGGVALVYMYFQIPLMVLVILPAFEGLRPAWREAAQNMGANGLQSMADRVGVMKDGKLEQIALPDQLYAEPATAFVAEFVGTMNRLPGELEGADRVRALDTVVPVHGERPPGDVSEVDVLVRPEGLLIAAVPGGNGIVTDRSFLGSVSRISVRLSGDLTVKVDHPSVGSGRFAPGESVQISLPGAPVLVAERQ